jgi:hypothetical protein
MASNAKSIAPGCDWIVDEATGEKCGKRPAQRWDAGATWGQPRGVSGLGTFWHGHVCAEHRDKSLENRSRVG